jgi:hypothetical protein
MYKLLFPEARQIRVERAHRAALLGLAYRGERAEAVAALDALYKEYHLRLPLAEAQWQWTPTT